MARSPLTPTTDDLITDGGSVLWSFIIGEQLEYPVVINFISDVTNYTLEAVVIEANNTATQTEAPSEIKQNGIQTTLTARKPNVIGTWAAVNAYNYEDVVLYSGLYYKLLSGTARVNATTPALDPLWEVTTLNKIYLQFPSTLGSTWAQAPTVAVPVYGFFELRVTEPSNSILTRTWKPIRGLVELLFSPTHIVP